jgi:3-hydroxyisobutyrate dehydrogenase-like beta-hydroxyacid dehydrogenase
MSEVTIIGLGAMGSALARALVASGRRVTVWNRTPDKASSLIKEGAVLASSAALAVGASPVGIVCVSNYDVTRTILGTDEAATVLPGRLLIQLSGGGPQEARDSEVWAGERGVQYLDGAIMNFPEQIGTPNATILLSGAESAFRAGELFLKILAPNLLFLGEKVGLASALNFAVVSFFFGGIVGSLHGVRICEAEGLPVEEYGSLLGEIAPLLGGDVKNLAQSIQAGEYENPQARLKTWAAGSVRIEQHARESQINSEFPAFASALCRKGIAAGYGMEGVASLIKILRAGAKSA